jgi:hypothetical protein
MNNNNIYVKGEEDERRDERSEGLEQ